MGVNWRLNLDGRLVFQTGKVVTINTESKAGLCRTVRVAAHTDLTGFTFNVEGTGLFCYALAQQRKRGTPANVRGGMEAVFLARFSTRIRPMPVSGLPLFLREMINQLLFDLQLHAWTRKAESARAIWAWISDRARQLPNVKVAAFARRRSRLFFIGVIGRRRQSIVRFSAGR